MHKKIQHKWTAYLIGLPQSHFPLRQVPYNISISTYVYRGTKESTTTSTLKMIMINCLHKNNVAKSLSTSSGSKFAGSSFTFCSFTDSEHKRIFMAFNSDLKRQCSGMHATNLTENKKGFFHSGEVYKYCDCNKGERERGRKRWPRAIWISVLQSYEKSTLKRDCLKGRN